MVNNNKSDNKKESSSAGFYLVILAFTIISATVLPILLPDLKHEIEKRLKPTEAAKTHFSIYENDFFEADVLKRLQDIFRTVRISIIADDIGVESAGERVPVGHPDCQHPLMTLNANRTLCHFPHRLDIALHYMKTGGFGAKFDTPDKLVSRLYSFRHKLMSVIDEKELYRMYGDKFINKAKQICISNDPEKYTLDTLRTEIFQFDVIIILPGQELPMHIDIPYFWGADRKSLPHWLLAVMKQSRLFDNLFIPQVQGVSWLSKHQFNKNEEDSKFNGGNFYFFPHEDNIEQYNMVKAAYNAAILVDGTQVIHGVEPYKPLDQVPVFDKNNRYYVKFDEGADQWSLYDYKDALIRNYQHDDIRISLVWRVHCFKDDDEHARYKSQAERLSVEEVAEIFRKDLKSKNKLPDGVDLRPLDLWMLVVKEYTLYPVNIKPTMEAQ